MCRSSIPDVNISTRIPATAVSVLWQLKQFLFRNGCTVSAKPASAPPCAPRAVHKSPNPNTAARLANTVLNCISLRYLIIAIPLNCGTIKSK
jgi:hypothetical protein